MTIRKRGDNVKQIDATIYFGIEGARTNTIIFVEDDATDETIREELEAEALSNIEFDWHERQLK